MNSCDKSSLTLLIAGLLDEKEAQAARAHLETCPACREHYVEMERLCERLKEPVAKVPSLTPPPDFHARLKQSLQGAKETKGGADFLLILRSWFTGPRLALAGGVCLVAIVVTLRDYPDRTSSSGTVAVHPPALPAPARQPELAQTSTALAYQLAMNESFEALEALLEQNARQGTPSATTLALANRSPGRD